MMMLRVLSGLPHKTILMVAQAGTFQLVQVSPTEHMQACGHEKHSLT